MPYRRAASLLTKGERAIWPTLCLAMKGKYLLFTKVRLQDIALCPDSHQNESYWFDRIARFHVDFVVCERETVAPLLVIELDDGSHDEGECRKRDAVKNEVLGVANIPIYRIKAQVAYDAIAIGENIERLIKRCPTSAPPVR